MSSRFIEDYDLPKSTPVGARREMIAAAEEANEQVKKWACRLRDIADDVADKCDFEPRERLPTPAEEAAHLARHGDGAGWMGQCFIDGEWARPIFTRERSRGTHDHPVRSWPALANGRPVAWPEVTP